MPNKQWIVLNPEEPARERIHILEVDGERVAVMSYAGGHVNQQDYYHTIIKEKSGRKETHCFSDILSEAKEQTEQWLEIDDPKPEPRPETGPLQFGDDWPGTFIRGDESFNYQIQLSQAIELLDSMPNPGGLNLVFLKQLRDLLASSEVGKGTPTKIKAFKACQTD